MSDADTFAQNPEIQKLRDLLSTHSSEGWDIAWKQQITPWDAGKVHAQPPLIEVIHSGELSSVKGRALVPGCGRGYDAIYIAKELGLETLGLDLSETALEAAKALLDTQESRVKALVKFGKADFFQFNPDETDKFILVYDYTFFCAIPPSLRKSWGQQITRLTKPDALLVTLVFPIDGDRETGPPYSVSVEAYTDSLGSSWTKLTDRIPVNISEVNKGKERIVIWRKVVA